jgi:hypothetical protein
MLAWHAYNKDRNAHLDTIGADNLQQRSDHALLRTNLSEVVSIRQLEQSKDSHTRRI